MKIRSLIVVVMFGLALVFWLTGCGSTGQTDTGTRNLPEESTLLQTPGVSETGNGDRETVNREDDTDTDTPQASITIEKTEVIRPSDLVYQGAFRLPDEYVSVWDDQVNFWSYAGMGMAFYSDGDPSGENDGFPGSLFAVGHDISQFVSEISIP
ncbi:MAG: hypothetical protein JW712_06360, partial [Dehalococcoidales bacterium]|nr:hypothetical protein [Dehalococcoidales bacterium]